jgi:hypothetical protein
MNATAQVETDFDAQFNALQIVAKMAYDYVNNLQPGDRYLGLQAEAARHFDIGSEGYGLFIGCATHQMRNLVMDVDGDRRIISIVRVKQ